jgi:hypothetical protein
MAVQPTDNCIRKRKLLECVWRFRGSRTNLLSMGSLGANIVPCTDIMEQIDQQIRDERILYLSMVLQPIVEPWSLLSFLTFYTVGRTPWTGDQPVSRPLHAQTGHKHRINAHWHPCLKWDSKPWSQYFSGRRPRGHCDRHQEMLH